MAAWVNWARTQRCEPAAIERPGSRARGGRGASARARRAGPRGRRRALVHGRRADRRHAALARAAWTACSTSTAASGLVRVEAGITLHALSRELHVRGLALPNLGDIDAQSLAGALATGTHGTGARLPNLSAQVEAIELVLGRRQRARRSTGGDLLRAARVGLGALGVVVAVTLRCVPAFRLHGVDAPEPLEDVLGSLERARRRARPLRVLDVPALAAGAHPHEHAHRGAAHGAAAAAREWLEDVLLDNHALRRSSTAPAGASRGAIPALNRAASRAASRRERVDWSFRVFASPRLVRFDGDGVRDPARARRRGGARRAARSSSATRSRSRSSCASSAADDALLSPAHGRDSAYVAVHVFEGMPWEAPFREVEALMRALRRPPALGQALVPATPPSSRRATRGGRRSRPRGRSSIPAGRFDERRGRARVARLTGSAALAPVGRHGRHAPAALRRGGARRSARTARPPWRGGTTRGRRPAARRRPGRAAASGPRRRPPGGRAAGPAGAPGAGRRSRPAGARGGVAAAEHGRDAARRAGARPAARTAPPGAGVKRGRRRTASGAKRPEPAATSVTAGSAAVRSTEPVPPPLTNRSGATARTAATTAARRAGQLARRGALHRPQRGAEQRLPAAGRRRRRSAPRSSSARRARARGAQRPRARAPPPARACAAASAWRRSGPARRAATSPRRRRGTPGRAPPARPRDQVEVLAAVDHQRDRARAPARGQRAQRRAVDGRVGDDDVVEPVPGQPQRLGQREGRGSRGSPAASARSIERAAADGLRGEPDAACPPRAAQQVGGVGVERVEVDDRERRVERGGGGVQAARDRTASRATYPP